MRFEATPLLAGHAAGSALVLTEPVSFWGGVNAVTGRIVEARHPQAGTSVTGTILLLPFGKGSSSGSSVLAEALQKGTGPAAIVLSEADEILLIGAVVAQELYGLDCPVVVAPDAFGSVETGDRLVVDGTSVSR